MELNKLKISVSSASGVEGITKREIYNLIGKEVAFLSGRADFFGSISDVARLNICLRTANKVYVVLKEFTATTFDELFEGVYSFEWNKLLEKNAKVFVDAKSVKSALFALSSIQSITKKAIVNSLTGKDGFLNETGKEYFLEVSILNDKVSILLNTSGQGLHKRGYRDLVWKAPLKETLASAIVLNSVYKWDRPLIDPCCGSGTIALESALIGQNIAPGINREFALEKCEEYRKFFDAERSRAKDEEKRDRKLTIYGYDIESKAINLCYHHAKNAGVEKCVHFERRDARKLSSGFSHGIIITNPPYGERLLGNSEIESLYTDFFKRFLSLDEWCLYFLSSYENTEKCFNKKADKRRKMYNSSIECTLYTYLGKPPKKERE